MQVTRHLDFIPALGFQSEGCNSVEFQFKFDGRSILNDEKRENAKQNYIIHNITKIIGYIPLFGSLMGVARIAFSCKFSKQTNPNKNAHIMRGIVELIPVLGTSLIIPDLAVTAYRLIKFKAVPLTSTA